MAVPLPPSDARAAKDVLRRYRDSVAMEQALEQALVATSKAYDQTARLYHAYPVRLPLDERQLPSWLDEHLAALAGLVIEQQEELETLREITQQLATQALAISGGVYPPVPTHVP